MSRVIEGYNRKPLSASGQVFTGIGMLSGFLCTAAGTMRVEEGTADGATIMPDVIDVLAGSFYNIPCNVANGVYATLGGGAHGTFFWAP